MIESKSPFDYQMDGAKSMRFLSLIASQDQMNRLKSSPFIFTCHANLNKLYIMTEREMIEMDQDNQDGSWQEKQDLDRGAVYRQPESPAQSNMALAALVMGILGIITSCCCYGGLIFGSLGILFALLSRTEDRFEGYAKAGLITSSIAIVLVVLVIIVFVGTAAMSGLGLGGVFS